MRKIILFTLFIAFMLFLVGCDTNNIEKNPKEFSLHQKMIKLDGDNSGSNPNWKIGIAEELQNTYKLPESTSAKIMDKGSFQQYRFLYAAAHEYNGEKYPYCFKLDYTIWKSEGYYAICEVNDINIESQNSFYKLKLEGAKEPWIDDLNLFKVFSADQSMKLTMGIMSVSFHHDGNKKEGPFTLVNDIYISYPSL